RSADPGIPQPGQECGRGRARKRRRNPAFDLLSARRAPGGGRQRQPRSSAAGGVGDRQRRRHSRGFAPASIRSLHLDQAQRQGTGPGAGRQGGGRSWRRDRIRQPAAPHHVPGLSAGGAASGYAPSGVGAQGRVMTEPSTILVADDDRAIRTVLTQALGRLGHNVRTTGNAAQLWRWVEDGEGDLVITDVVMPDEDGLDLVPRIKKQRPDLRVIVMSAQNTLLTAVKATERGAFEYLPKPFDLRELVNVVERALSVPHGAAAAVAAGEAEDADEALPLIG